MPFSTNAMPIDKSIPGTAVSGLKKDAAIDPEHREATMKTMDMEFERNMKKREKAEACKESKKNISQEAGITKNVSEKAGISKNVSKEASITKNVSEKACIRKDISQEAGGTKTEGSPTVPLAENDVKNTEDAESKVSVKNATSQTDAAVKYKLTPIITKSNTHCHANVAVPRDHPPISTPFLGERPLVLATHLVPSLPISLFEVLLEAIELATEKPVVLLHEPRADRTVAKEVTDIAILPASDTWDEGELLPVSFCFEHHLNKSKSPGVYVDVVVATDCTSYIEDITDLRGHRCALSDRQKQVGAAALLFNHLYSRGESPSFFGNILDASTQVATLQMVAGKQAELGAVESPVIKCHKNTLPGMESLHILTSLGPLPPYRIMVNKSLSDVLVKKITAYLLNVDQDMEWVQRFAPFGVSFVKNSTEFYDISDIKSVVTSVPYY